MYCTAYLNNILIFSETLENYHRHIKDVLKRLIKAGLFADINKSEFYVTKVKYLGMIITTKGIRIDLEKVQTILEWQVPQTVQDLLAFLGFANFYRIFIEAFSCVVLPLTDLTKGDIKGKSKVKI